MKKHLPLALLSLLLLVSPAIAEEDDDSELPLNIYGYFSVNHEKNWAIPELDDKKNTIRNDEPSEWAIPNFKLMMQQSLGENFKAYINLTGDGAEGVSVRNVWGEYIFNDALKIRAGKLYRPFDLYNEKLDAVPTYLGIEAPELFDKDHLLLERTTNFMLHGNAFLLDNKLSYALTTDNGEGGPDFGIIPLGWNANYTFDLPFNEWKNNNGFDTPFSNFKNTVLIGTSGYVSSLTGKASSPTQKTGSPDGGIPNWMKSSNFNVFGGYAQTFLGNLQLEGAYYRANHSGTRNETYINDMVKNAGLTDFQKNRFIGSDGKVITKADYTIQTYYVRLGYKIKTDIGEFLPYVFYDYYQNPEIIEKKAFGGDKEAGRADDGAFIKPTLGFAYRPNSRITFKVDSSLHIYQFNKKTEMFPEIRFDLSYYFGNI